MTASAINRRDFIKGLAILAPLALAACGGAAAPASSSAPASSAAPAASVGSPSAPASVAASASAGAGSSASALASLHASASASAGAGGSATASGAGLSGPFKTGDDVLAALKQFSGKTITLGELTAPTLSKDQLANITAKSGVTLNVTAIPATDAFQKFFLDLSTSAGNYDFITFQPFNLGAFSPFLVDLTDLNKKYGWNYSDVLPTFQWYGWYPNQQTGKPFALPRGGDLFFLHYRQDVLDAAGVAIPKTYDDLLKAAQKLNGYDFGGKKMIGFLPRTSRALTYTWWANIFGAYGGDWFSADWKPAVNTDAAVQSLDTALNLVKAGPPNAGNLGFADINKAWLNGDAALTMHYPVTATLATQSKDSQVAGKVGTAALPSGPAGSRPAAIGGQTFAVSKASKNPEAAYLLMRYYLMPDVAVTQLINGVAAVLKVELQDPGFVKALGEGKTTAAAEEAMMSGKVLAIPAIPEWNSLSEVLDLNLSQVWTGQQQSKAALDAVAANWQQQLDKAGYYKPGVAPYAVQQ